MSAAPAPAAVAGAAGAARDARCVMRAHRKACVTRGGEVLVQHFDVKEMAMEAVRKLLNAQDGLDLGCWVRSVRSGVGS